MKKLLLFALLASFVGTAQAQQTSVRAPEIRPQYTLDKMTMESPSMFRDIMAQERQAMTRATKKTNSLKKTNTAGSLFDIGKSANTYGMIGDTRNQISFDPVNNNLAVIFRGNDRGAGTVGNTLFIRYSTDNGTTWGSQGDNIANTAEPRYPNIFLSNDGGATSVNALWPQTTLYGDGKSGFGLVAGVRSGMNNANQVYSSFATPPLWGLPFETFLDQTNGDLYTAAYALDPASGASFDEVYLFRSTDKGATWTTDQSNPIYEPGIHPTGYFDPTFRFDISPDGSTMVMAFALIMETEPGSNSALISSPDHEIGWRVSTDKGVTWGPIQRVKPSEIANKPAPFNGPRCDQTWDFDMVLDNNNNPHFLTVLAADELRNGEWIEVEIDGEDTTRTTNAFSTDSTFVTEIVNVDGEWKMYPVGPVRLILTRRGSFTAGTTGEVAYPIRNEVKWARSWAGDKIYAKWISPWRTWIGIKENIIYNDSLSQLYVNGRHVGSHGKYIHEWKFDAPDEFETMYRRDSIMRYTTTHTPFVDEFDAFSIKFTKVAKYASNNGDVHVVAQEWGVADLRDQDPVNGDQTVWYVQGVKIDVMTNDVELVDAVPGNLHLQQNYPNPFNPSTEISFTLPTAGQTVLRVYNVLGQNVATLANEYLTAGTHKVTFDAGSLPTGMYLYRLESGSANISKKMMLSK